jgi:hypothetical protein
MTEYELNQILAEYTHTLNQLTEFWLTVSFGVIVAATYVPSKIGSKFHNMLLYGYACASIIFVFGRANFTFMAIEIGNRMEEMGYEPLKFHPFFGPATSIGIFLVMVFGSIGVLFYVRHASKSVN